jgi:two-component system chemotaxis response regulator CheY
MAHLNKTIMIVDDSSSLRTLARLAFEKAGYDVVEANDGREAIERLDSALPALIVCDIHMPNMDGLEFVQHLKTSPLHRFTPVVMLTTSVDAQKKASAREAGVAAWIGKPFEAKVLVDAIERLCK